MLAMLSSRHGSRNLCRLAVHALAQPRRVPTDCIHAPPAPPRPAPPPHARTR